MEGGRTQVAAATADSANFTQEAADLRTQAATMRTDAEMAQSGGTSTGLTLAGGLLQGFAGLSPQLLDDTSRGRLIDSFNNTFRRKAVR